MRRLWTTTSFVLVTSLGLSAPEGAKAQALSGNLTQCSISSTRSAVENISLEALCSCETITSSFIEYIQRHPNYADILVGAGEACPGLALLLSDDPTGAIGNAESDSDPSGGTFPGDGDGDGDGDG
ncbi:MAG: hypothetical protein WBV71_17115, partial [Roseobacter sp.]